MRGLSGASHAPNWNGPADARRRDPQPEPTDRRSPTQTLQAPTARRRHPTRTRVTKRQVQAYAEGRQRVADEATEKGPGGQLEGRHHRLEDGIAAAGPMRA